MVHVCPVMVNNSILASPGPSVRSFYFSADGRWDASYGLLVCSICLEFLASYQQPYSTPPIGRTQHWNNQVNNWVLWYYVHTTFVSGLGPNQITIVFSVTAVRLVRVLGRLQPQIDIKCYKLSQCTFKCNVGSYKVEVKIAMPSSLI